MKNDSGGWGDGLVSACWACVKIRIRVPSAHPMQWAQVMQCMPVILAMGRQKEEDPWGLLTGESTWRSESQVQWETLKQKLRQRHILPSSFILYIHTLSHTCTFPLPRHTYMHTNMQKHTHTHLSQCLWVQWFLCKGCGRNCEAFQGCKLNPTSRRRGWGVESHRLWFKSNLSNFWLFVLKMPLNGHLRKSPWQELQETGHVVSRAQQLPR